MTNNTFSQWCRAATQKIRYGPDRRAVQKELLAHLEDHRDVLMEQGMTEEDATQKALETMGSAEEIAPQLAEIHKPFWGYLYFLCKAAFLLYFICLSVFCFVKLIGFTNQLPYAEVYTPYFDADINIPSMRGQVYYDRPNASQVSDGYRMVLTEAAVWADYGPDYIFYCQMKVRVAYPWLDEPQIEDHFWAEDNLGNTYCTKLEGYTSDNPQMLSQSLYCTSTQTGPMTYIYEFHISDFIYPDVQWLDIHYSRDGRSLTWRIYLTGGAQG